ncbi:hypothetical protein [Halomonas sp. C22]|uniref:hypothetical protein n=1 Tax=Halomonas sp. C22 TaxID=2580567 RepID=UPI0011A13F1B|nr:hypothetical protein [Halomonas sp. C22]
MNTITDSELEYYADRFMRLRIARHGFNLAQYLVNPLVIERLALEPEPLLPQQHATVLRFWQRWDTGLAAVSEAASEDDADDEIQAAAWDWRDLLDRWREETAEAERALARMNQRNGAYVEPMRHHRHHGRNRTAANFARKGA